MVHTDPGISRDGASVANQRLPSQLQLADTQTITGLRFDEYILCLTKRLHSFQAFFLEQFTVKKRMRKRSHIP